MSQTKLKTPEQLEIMRKGGKILVGIVQDLALRVRDGILTTPLEVEQLAQKFCDDAGVIPGTKGYHGFPSALCVSVNYEVVHGIPRDKPFKAGDLVKLDMVIKHDGLMVDTAVTVPYLDFLDGDKLLAKTAHEALKAGIAASRVGNTIADIGKAIYEVNRRLGYSAPTGFGGHGIGENMHEEPGVPNEYFESDTLIPLQAGMTIAIEPISMPGPSAVKIAKDGWTVVALSGMRSAHFEHTIAITDGEPEILTLWAPDKFKSILGIDQ